MPTLNSGQRRYLRQQAHNLRPTVQIGKNGITGTLIEAVNGALEDHELIKVKFNGAQDDKRDLATQIAGQTKSELVQVIGNVVVLFRYQHDPHRRKVELPRSEDD